MALGPRSKNSILGLVVVLLILMVSSIGHGPPIAPVSADAFTPIPAQADWTDYGPILTGGALGEWDYLLWGGFAGTVVKQDGTYYLYYQGVSGYRTSYDESVLWRAVGVATSPDGINFTKSDHNPVVTWFPNNEGEEGAASAAATLDNNGETVLYYGANTARSTTIVNADGRLATSADGLSFADRGVVLDHTDESLWGSGDELFPVIAIHDAGQWFIYYVPNGTLQRRTLGVAWGPRRDDLTQSSAARSGGFAVQAWGMGASAEIGPDTYALFLSDVTRSQIEVRTVSLDTPNQLSAPIQTYRFDKAVAATVLLDKETNTWFMYYRGDNRYGVKLAPAGEPDATPPTAPANVIATPISDRQVDLSWSPATDSETGIVLYEVFRDGTHLATVKGLAFSDTGLAEKTAYTYQVSAVNYHGVKGPGCVPVTATTLPDVTPPRITSVNVGGSSTQVTVVFDEPVEQASAENPANYVVDRCMGVIGASLNPDRKTVVLTSTAHTNGTYRITANGIQDRANSTPNTIVPGTAVNYTCTGVPGLVGAWLFDEGVGNIAIDTATYGNPGALVYTAKPGPLWTTGKFGRALQFDGTDDQVTINGSGSLQAVTDNSHTFAAWVRPDSVPPNTSVNNASYSILVRQYTGLYYDHSRKFRAQIRLSDGTEVTASSGVFEPGTWHHLVMVVDDANKSLHLFIDGQEASGSPVNYTGTLADHRDVPYYIGTSEPLTELYEYRFNGKIDQAHLFDRALSASEAQLLFSWSPGDPTCLEMYLPLVLRAEKPEP